MGVSCNRRIEALWANYQSKNAWVWLSDAGWRKLDDRNGNATTKLLAIASLAKSRNAAVMVNEDLRGDTWYVTQIYDFSLGIPAAATEVSNRVNECIFGWTSAYRQQGTHITARIQLVAGAGVSDAVIQSLQETWKRAIEDKWSYRFSCCTSSSCSGACALTFEVQWTSNNPHLTVNVLAGSGRANLSTWYVTSSGNVAAHEFGHLLGHPDEYADARCPARSPVNTGTVMDDNTQVVQRLCRPFCDNLSLPTTTA